MPEYPQDHHAANRAQPVRTSRLAFFTLVTLAAVHIYWGLGFRSGLNTFLAYEGEREAEIIASPWFTAFGFWGVATLSLVGSAMAAAVLRGWDGTDVSRRLVMYLATAAAGILITRARFGLVSSTLRLARVVGRPADVDSG